jgi:hypothetical protein
MIINNITKIAFQQQQKWQVMWLTVGRISLHLFILSSFSLKYLVGKALFQTKSMCFDKN